MNPHPVLDAICVLVVLLDLMMLGTSRLASCIRIFAYQSALLALMPLIGEALPGEAHARHAILVALGAIALKVVLIPKVLLRLLRTGEIHREVEPFIGFTASVLLGALIVVGSFAAMARMPLPAHPMSDFLMPASMATVFIGLLILVSRAKAVTQVVGFLVVENGIFLFGMLLLKQTPILVELGILLDLFVGVFIMGIVVYHIRREFDHMDTNLLDALKES
jgi:hydrogenase-4 component E